MILVVLVAAASAFHGGVARAETTGTCDKDGTRLEVHAQTDPNTDPTGNFALFRDAAGRIFLEVEKSYGAHLQRCRRATVFNINRVVVTGGAGAERFGVITFKGGFRPGKTKEAEGRSEIEFRVSLGAGADTAMIEGPGDRFGPSNIRFGTKGANVNGDRDADVVFDLDVEVIGHFAMGNTEDTVSGAGGRGTGHTVQRPMVLHGNYADNSLEGGHGDDRILGSGGDDRLIGRAGDDVIGTLSVYDSTEGGHDFIRAGAGSDFVNGDNCRDTILGGAGGDELEGDLHSDHIKGQNGNDSLRGGDGPDHLDGGEGIDTCDVGPGGTTQLNCEV